MRKLILRWLFGVDVERYMELLIKYRNLSDIYLDEIRRHCERIEAHIKTLDELEIFLQDMMKLIKICEKHGIDVDKEIKEVEL